MSQGSIWGRVKEAAPVMDSAVDFPTKTRFHIALNVKSVETTLPFYQSLFDATPHTIRDGYAKFELQDPPLHISLNEVPKNAKGNGIFGIQAKNPTTLEQMVARIKQVGPSDAAPVPSTTVTKQGRNKLTVRDPEGNTWQIFA
jgi:predicted enzyme related to lactoylglutathione lyase